MSPLKENRPALVAASSEAEKQCELPFNHSTPALRFSYPSADTLPALAFAIMLKGREVSTPSFTYGEAKATRLPAYVDDLRQCGLGELIKVGDLQLTPLQRKRKHKKPFAKYWLEPFVIIYAGDMGQEWADKVLVLNGLDIESFPVSNDWLECIGVAK